jgi:hypothetical protein
VEFVGFDVEFAGFELEFVKFEVEFVGCAPAVDPFTVPAEPAAAGDVPLEPG